MATSSGPPNTTEAQVGPMGSTTIEPGGEIGAVPNRPKSPARGDQNPETKHQYKVWSQDAVGQRLGELFMFCSRTAQSVRQSLQRKNQNAPDANSLARIDNYRRGYPSMAAFQNSDPCFSMVRRFGALHTRSLLYQQDELSLLEAQLNTIDNEDPVQLYLSSRRHDRNERRKVILLEIRQKLKEYDKALIAHQQILSLPPPRPRNVNSFLRWMDSTKPLIQDESQFLQNTEDFVTFTEPEEYGFLEEKTENCLTRLRWSTCFFRTKRETTKTSSEGVHYYSVPRITATVRLAVTLIAVILLLVPVVILYFLNGKGARLSIVAVFTLVFSTILALFTRAKRSEILAATAAYCAVLVVFVGSVS